VLGQKLVNWGVKEGRGREEEEEKKKRQHNAKKERH
jgi:hypothetical protein